VEEIRTEALWDRQHPLPRGDVWQHVVGEVGGDLAHAPGIARRADAPALARERDQPLVTAILAAGPCESIGQNAALEVAAEVAFDPLRQSVAHRVVRGRNFALAIHDERIEGTASRKPVTDFHPVSERRRSLVPIPVPLQTDKTSNQPSPTPGRSWGNALKSEKLPESNGKTDVPPEHEVTGSNPVGRIT
jgi:hypothetical protein